MPTNEWAHRLCGARARFATLTRANRTLNSSSIWQSRRGSSWGRSSCWTGCERGYFGRIDKLALFDSRTHTHRIRPMQFRGLCCARNSTLHTDLQTCALANLPVAVVVLVVVIPDTNTQRSELTTKDRVTTNTDNARCDALQSVVKWMEHPVKYLQKIKLNTTCNNNQIFKKIFKILLTILTFFLHSVRQ